MTNQTPAEALRQQILKDGTVSYSAGSFTQKLYSNDTASPIEQKVQQVVQIGVDDLMELVTAYAATVERKAAIKENQNMKKLLNRIPVKYINDKSLWSNGYNDAVFELKGKVISRLAALQGPPEENNGDSK